MTAILDLSEGRVGFSNFVGTGNKTVLDERSLIGYLADDKETRVISFYAESLGSAPEIIRLGRDIMERPEPKPIVALKSGRTESGIRASGSHTGSLAGTDAAYDALFRQARILRAESMRQFLDTVSALAENPVPNGPNTVIVTNAGGPGVIAADAATKAGLSVRTLSEETASALRPLLPPAASVGNPVDLLGDAKADRYRAILGPIVEAEETDAVIVILTPQSMTEAEETAEAIIRAKKDSGKPVFAVFAGGSSVENAVSLLQGSGVSVFTYPEDAADVLGLLVRISGWRKKTVSPLRSFKDLDRERVRSIIDGVREEGRKDLTGQEAESVLAAYRFPLLESRLASDPESAEKAAREIGGSVALKIASPDITHKTDAGGVMLDIPAEDVAGKYSELVERVRANRPDAKIDGVTVMEMGTPEGKELILGVKREEGLGTLVLVGMGGIYAETLKDVSFRFAPLAPEDVDEMLSELRILPLLRGVRGEEGVDMTPITESLERLSRLVEDFPEIAELDINPLSVHPDGKRSRVLDARITIV
jgi:acetyltransferase